MVNQLFVANWWCINMNLSLCMTMTKSIIMKTQASSVQSQSYCLRTRHTFLSPCSGTIWHLLCCYQSTKARLTQFYFAWKKVNSHVWCWRILGHIDILCLWILQSFRRDITTSNFCFSSGRRSWVQRFILAIVFWSIWEYSQPLRCHYGYVSCSLLPSLSQLLSHLKWS